MCICSPTTQSAGGIRWHFIVFYLLNIAAWCSGVAQLHILACSHCHSAFVVVELLFSGKVAFYAPPTPLWQACEWPVCPHAQFPPHGLTCTWHCLLACICGCMWMRSSRNIVWRSQPTCWAVCEAEMGFHQRPGGWVSTPTLAGRWFGPWPESIVSRVVLHSSHAELCDN